MPITASLKNFKSFIKSRHKLVQDSEPEQAIIRIIVGIALTSIYCLPWGEEETFALKLSELTSQTIFAGFIIANVIYLAILFNPKPSPIRRVVGTTLDVSLLTIVLAASKGEHIVLIAFYFWITIGNGFRYGLNYLYYALAISLISISFIFASNEYWRENLSVAITFILILFIIPVYSSFLIKKLHNAIEEAKEANEAKSQFLANMSHELRTPLNGVIGLGQLLRETKLSYEQSELAYGIHNSASTLLGLIENVLDISKIEAGKFIIDKQPFDLHKLITSVRYVLAPLAETKRNVISCNIDPSTPFSLVGDEPHLKQVLINLISNAIKFTEEGSVQINVYPVGSDKKEIKIRFEVVDSGIGMTEEEQKRIFEHFIQANKTTYKKFGGTGLGTTISRDLVELMGGEIGVSSKVGEGSMFWFELAFKKDTDENESLDKERLLLLLSVESASFITPAIKGWDLDFDWSESPTKALTLLTQSSEENHCYGSMIVDQNCLKGISPIQFAGIIRSEKNICPNLSLILINSSDAVIQENLANQQYISALQTFDDKRLLFNSLHAAQTSHLSNDNVVALSDYYASLGSVKNLNILVAEDNQVNQHVIRGILENAGHHAIVVDDGDEALDVLSSDPVDLLIVDMNMPKMSGIEVVKALRFMHDISDMPVIMLTADATPEAKLLGMEAGVNSFLTKPIDAKFLLEKIATLTKKNNTEEKGASKKLTRVDVPANQQPAYINFAQLNELLNLSTGVPFVRKIIDSYIDSGYKYIRNIKSCSQDDYPGFRKAVHTLKGSSHEVFATKMVNICLQCEELKPYDINTDELFGLISELESTFEETIAELKRYISGIENAQTRDHQINSQISESGF